MAVSPVKIISVIGVNNRLDEVLNFLGSTKAFQPENVFSFYSDTHEFEPLLKKNPFDEPLRKLKSLIGSIGKKPEDLNDLKLNLSKKESLRYVKDFSEELDHLIKQRNYLDNELDNRIRSETEISHFVGLDLDFQKITSCKYIKIRFGRIPKENFSRLSLYKDNPYVLFFKCTSDQTHYWGVYMAPIEHVKEVDMIFSSLYFERLKVYGVESTPEKAIESLKEQIAKLELEKRNAEEEIEKFWEKEKINCSRVYNKILEYYTYYNIRAYGAKYGNSFILTGWIPKDKETYFNENLKNIHGIEYAIDNAEESKNHPPPTLLKNKKFFRPFEFFVDMYGLPNYREADPTIFVAITYILMFGIMFGDFGNGLVLSIVGYLMWKFKKMKLGKLIIPCGICSMFFGLLFGSCFGFEDAFDWFYKDVFHLNSKPISVMEPATTNNIIYSAVGLGLVLVMIAMVINIYSMFKQKRYGEGIFGANGICGLVFYASVVFGALLQFILNIEVLNIFYIIGFMIIPLVLIMFGEVLGKLIEHKENWKPESWSDYISQNIFELFETVLSYLTNTISFLRVGAYVLVHAGMLLVVFTLAEMTSGAAYVIILIIGNAFVIALEGLLVGIQVLRLEFYEMFSRCYSGDGEPFTPVVVKDNSITNS